MPIVQARPSVLTAVYPQPRRSTVRSNQNVVRVTPSKMAAPRTTTAAAGCPAAPTRRGRPGRGHRTFSPPRPSRAKGPGRRTGRRGRRSPPPSAASPAPSGPRRPTRPRRRPGRRCPGPSVSWAVVRQLQPDEPGHGGHGRPVRCALVGLDRSQWLSADQGPDPGPDQGQRLERAQHPPDVTQEHRDELDPHPERDEHADRGDVGGRELAAEQARGDDDDVDDEARARGGRRRGPW